MGTLRIAWSTGDKETGEMWVLADAPTELARERWMATERERGREREGFIKKRGGAVSADAMALLL